MKRAFINNATHIGDYASEACDLWREVDATTVQEVCLLWALAWPLFFQTLANEIQLVITTALYGHLGETDLAAANDKNCIVFCKPSRRASEGYT